MEDPSNAPPLPDENNPSSFPVGDGEPPNPTAPALPVPADGGASRLLLGLAKVTPFLDLHDRAVGDSKWRARFCFALDLTLRLTVYAALLGAIVAVAWKTLAPFPPFWQNH